MMDWYMGLPFGADDRTAWHDAIREVAELTNDTDALAFVEAMERFWSLLREAGILVGSPKPPPEKQDALYAELDTLLGVT